MSETVQELVWTLIESGDHSEALIAADAESDSSKGLLLKACALCEVGRFSDCIDLLGRIEDLDLREPTFKHSFYHQRARAASKMGRTDAALIDYEAAKYWAAKSGDPLREANARNNLAKLYAEAGRIDEALVECHAAINTAERLNEQGLLGRYLDQKAQIFIVAGQFSNAVNVADRATRILEQHGNPSTLAEARMTCGKAHVLLGASYLDTLDPVDRCREGKAVGLNRQITEDLVQMALARTNGHVYQAAKLLGAPHASVIRITQSKKLDRIPTRRRRKSLIAK